MRVALFTEGTYPFVRGGVSTWCHDLIGGLPDIAFDVVALIGNPSARAEYDLPANVEHLIDVPLWGHERLTEFNAGDLRSGGRRDRRALREHFAPLFRAFLSEVMRGMEYSSPSALVAAIGELYRYFRTHDYDWTMRQRETWNISLDLFKAQSWHARFLTTLEAVELVRTIYRYLSPLALELRPFDLSHVSVAGLCALPAIAAKHTRGTPMILTEHGVYLRERVLALARAGFPFSDRTIKKNFFSAIARATYAAADVIAPVCSYNTTWEQFYGVDPQRLRVIYNGVDESRFEDRDEWPAVPTVGAVLRIDPLKDVLTMIASAQTVRRTIPSVRYELWGPVHDAEYNVLCQQLVAENGLQDTVHFMGSTKSPADAYARSTVVALSSISEGFPYTIIEAMMCGKAVVATDVGGVREAVADCGAVVAPKRPDAFGEALLPFLLDPAHARATGKRARARAFEHFTQSKFLETYRGLYGDVAGSRV